MKQLPDWMHPELPAVAGTLSNTGRRKLSPVRKALSGFGRVIEEMLSIDEIAARQGLLQGIDAKAKIIGLIGLLVVVTLAHKISSLLICLGACIVLAALSKVPAKRLARAWIMVTLFTAAFALPAALNVITKGRHLWTIWHLSPSSTLAVTDAGMMVAFRFFLRSGVCMTIAALLAVTTPTSRLLRGLRTLGVPQLFVMLLEMMQRYVGVLVRAAEEVHLAKISRSITAGNLRQEQVWTAAGLGSVFRRTQALSQQVYLAMLSRGYTGEPRLSDEPQFRGRDWVFLAAVGLFGAAIVLL